MRVILNNFTIILGFLVLGTVLAFPQILDVEWKVVGYAGEGWFEKPENVLGKTQTFHKGWAEGYFIQCEFQGLSKTHTRYNLEEFLANPEFALFKKLENQLEFQGNQVFVNRITCHENKKVLYPFVIIEPGNKAYYLYEGAIYIFEKK